MTSRIYFRLAILIMLFSSVLTACKKDPEVPTPNIVGKWKQQAYQYRIVYEVNGSKYDKTGTRRLSSGQTIEFKADGTTAGGSPAYTYTLSGDEITLRYGTEVTKGNVILSGDQLTLVGSDNLVNGLTETDKIKEAKGWAAEVYGSNGGDGEYTSLSKATKVFEIYAVSVYQRVP